MTHEMTSGSEIKLLLRFSVPVFLGNILQQCYIIVDSIIVGRFLGVHALAAIGAVTYLDWLVLGFGIAMAQGFAILASQRFGAKDHAGLRRSVAASFLLTLGIAALMTVVGLSLLELLLSILRTPPEIFALSKAYLTITFSCISIFMLSNLSMATLRALGDSKTPLVALLISSLINVGLDILFIVHFHMGVAGAAYATVIAQTCAWVFVVFRILRIKVLRFNRRDWLPEKMTIKRLLRLGIPAAMQNCVISVSIILLQIVVNTYGVAHVAAFSTATRIFFFIKEPGVTLGFALSSFVGQNFGAKKLDRLRSGVNKCLLMMAMICVVSIAIVLWLNRQMIGLVVRPDETEVISLAQGFLVILILPLPFLNFLVAYRAALQGLGNTFIPMLGGVVEFVSRILFVFTMPTLIGFYGVAIAEVSAWVGGSLLLGIAYYRTMRRLQCKYK